MAVIWRVDFVDEIKLTDKQIQSRINAELLKIQDYAEEISPTKSWEFQDNHDVVKAEIIWNHITGALVNDTPYALILEYGVKGRRYKYHKWPPTNDSTVFYTGVWNRTYTRVANKFK